MCHVFNFCDCNLECRDIKFHQGGETEVEKYALHVQKWLNGLEEEFFAQGDVEAKLGLQITPFMNRSLPGISTRQVTTGTFRCEHDRKSGPFHVLNHPKVSWHHRHLDVHVGMPESCHMMYWVHVKEL